MALNKKPRVMISAGHGMGSRQKGKVDPGANVKRPGIKTGDSLLDSKIASGKESVVTLLVARSLRLDFARLFNYKGGAVFLRDEGLYHLADDDAAAKDCDILAELHTNAGGGTGTEVLYGQSNEKALATRISSMLSKAYGLRNRGAKHRPGVAVLRGRPEMKQVLIELFFGDRVRDVVAFVRNYGKGILAIENSILIELGWKPLTKRPSKMTKAQLRAYKPY